MKYTIPERGVDIYEHAKTNAKIARSYSASATDKH